MVMKSLGLGGGGPAGSALGEDSNGNPALRTIVEILGSVYGPHPSNLYLETSGEGTGDNTVCFTLADARAYNVHMIQCSTGVVDIEVSLDGITWSPAASIALQDMGATASATHVLVTAGTGVYKLKGKFRGIRAVQNGATAATVVMVSGVE